MIDVANEDEVRALHTAVAYALRSGLASDDLESSHPSNRSLVSIGRKLGCDIPAWCDDVAASREHQNGGDA